MNNLTTDVTNISKDYLTNNLGATLEEVLDYTLLLLKEIYDKKFYKKNVYPEFIKQVICRANMIDFGIYYNNFVIRDRSRMYEYLRAIPYIEQRSPEWFKIKEDSVGASESASIFGKSPFSSEAKLLLKKCGHREQNSMQMNIACMHGTKFEPIVQLQYEVSTDSKLEEFGSLKHSKLSMVSASPDGITTNGIAIEIKVPHKRIITGIPTIYYWYQMQQQLQVCNLDRVDFIECKISEFLNKKEFLKDMIDEESANLPLTNDGLSKNVILEYHKLNTSPSEVGWIYPETFLKVDEIEPWLKTNIDSINNSTDKLYCRTIYYRIDKYSKCEVWRDDHWWVDNQHKFVEFWEKVLKYRKEGYEVLLKPKKKIVRKKKEPKCTILSDSDDNNPVVFKPKRKKQTKCLILSDSDDGIESGETCKTYPISKKKTVRAKKQTKCLIVSDSDSNETSPKPKKKTVRKKKKKPKCLIVSDSDDN